MEILACAAPGGVSRHTGARSCVAGPANLSLRAEAVRVSQKGGVLFGGWPRGVLSVAAPGINLHGGCWRLIAAVASGKSGKKPNGRKDGGKTKRNPEIQPAPEKKQAKANVWSAEFASGQSASARTENERSNRGAGRGGRGREGGGGRGGRARRGGRRDRGIRGGGAVVNGGGDVLVQSFNGATANVPAASERRTSQQRGDKEDTMFLRYLSPILPVVEETVLQPEEPVPNPLFTTFCSNASGVWRGVGATFSPITGDFEPIYLDEGREEVYDVRVVSTVENLRTSKDGKFLPPEQQSLHRKVHWSLEDPVTGDLETTAAAESDDEEDEDEDEEDDDVDDDDELEDELDDDDDDDYGEVDELGYLEDDEDTKEEDSSDWDLALADPGEIDGGWEAGEEAQGVVDEMEDTGPVREEVDTNWNLIWDRREVLGGDWEEGGSLPDGESGSDDLTAKQTVSSADGPSFDEEGFAEEGADAIEEDVVTLEPGLVYFEDGAFSRGPLELLRDASSSSREYFNAYTCKIEQCLVAGGHKRLRIVHTVSIEGEEKIEVLRLAVYEEEWMGPCNMKSISDAGGHRLELFSDRPRHFPEDVVGKWKVFEVEAMAIPLNKPSDKGSFVFSCKETSIKRIFPSMPKLRVHEDESIDLSDFSMSWLTGNVSTYVSLGAAGALTFGVGWVCDHGTRLVMERAYSEDRKLALVTSKSEIRAGP